MLIGLIAYISILKAEIGSKLRPRSTLQPALFKVTYGQSFFLFVFGFIATEFVGVLNIFLYIHLQEFNYYNVRIFQFIVVFRGGWRGAAIGLSGFRPDSVMTFAFAAPSSLSSTSRFFVLSSTFRKLLLSPLFLDLPVYHFLHASFFCSLSVSHT